MTSGTATGDPVRASGHPAKPWQLLSVLIGDVETFPLEHRISNGVMLVASILSIPATVTNVALELPPITAVLTALGAVVYAGLYVWSRHLRSFNGPALLTILIFALGYYPLLWITNNGLDGGIYYMGLIGLVSTSCIFSGRRRHVLSLLFVAVTAALFVGEYLGLLAVTSYDTRLTRFVDVFISFATGGAALVALVLVLKTSHRREHAKAVTYSQLLAATNAELGRCMLNQVRSADVAARWGGEEFVVLLPETPTDGALVMAERIRKTVEVHRFPGAIPVTISIGVATFQPGDSEDTLLGRADAAAYTAKRAGRNRVACS